MLMLELLVESQDIGSWLELGDGYQAYLSHRQLHSMADLEGVIWYHVSGDHE
jgi:hypothetical protein